MTPILADFTIDPATMNWLLGGTAAVLTTVGGGLWMAIRKLCEFLKPHIVDFFTSHKTLVDTMAEQAPNVTAMLAGVNRNLERFGETQTQHGAMLNQHGETLAQIKARLDNAKAAT
ncbi:hypothetical protein UFOVP1229_22 [uncultured Caudovirales phage]|uniref:Uncharacterized protein n=1 Tax=uncultured Caudovirales phage TaxID=2100421 RepID=A0A6J5RC77_9CAUD|nr:hypothetical protein UFOVP1229_22 [uncultured Caudovirales phage]